MRIERDYSILDSLSSNVRVKNIAYESYSEELTVTQICDTFFNHVKFDNKLAKKIFNYQFNYVNSKREYVEFYGSNLLGVHTLRYPDALIYNFYNDVVRVDYKELFIALSKVKTIDQNFKVASDPFNITLMYIIHRFLTANIAEVQRKRGAHDTALIFFYRCMAAITSDWFSYPVDPKIAQAAYARLNYKWLIKKLGSWWKVMDYRANELTVKNGLHYDKLIDMSKDYDHYVIIINDSQGRIRDIIKGYYNEFKIAHSEGDSIGSKSSTYLDVDGEETTVEKTHSVEKYVDLIRQVSGDRNSFIKDDLIRIVADINTNTSYRVIRETLEWMMDSINGPSNKLIDNFLTKTVIHSYFLIETNIEAKQRHDLAYVLLKLKNLYLSTRGRDTDLLEIRDLAGKIIKKAHRGLSEGLQLSTRTALILYITLRVLINKR